MPHMIPDDIEQFTTSGKEAVYRFLSCVAKPYDTPPVVAFGVSFPGSSSGRKVEYKVTNILWEQEYGSADDDQFIGAGIQPSRALQRSY